MPKNFTYIEGAKKIAEVCKGVSDYLDKLFDERYQTAYRNLKSLEKASHITH